MLRNLILLTIVIFVCTGCGSEKDARRAKKSEKPAPSTNQIPPLTTTPNEQDEPKKTVFASVWNEEMEIRLSNLPSSGSVPQEKIPYSGYWYPNQLGGTAIKWQGQALSALEKYDKSFNAGEAKAQQWERSASATNNASWAGHCNGWAAASQRHEEPRLPVKKNNITFQPRDIKALLAEIHMSAKPYFLGGNRCNQHPIFEIPFLSALFPQRNSNCKPINPGVFHTLLANWIGRKSHTIIFDKSNSSEVWNYPIYAFQSTIQLIERSQVNQYVGFLVDQHEIHPEATEFALVQTSITHADSFSPEQGESNTAPTRIAKHENYAYVLEMNARGEIVSGAWARDSKSTRPEFIWIAFEPFQNTKKDSMFGNPYLDIETVLSLWAESIGIDPSNLPQDILWPSNWPSFESTLEQN